jgi:hypothetical protein
MGNLVEIPEEIQVVIQNRRKAVCLLWHRLSLGYLSDGNKAVFITAKRGRMSVPIIENWSKISAEIVRIAESLDIKGYSEVELLVSSVGPVNDFPSLLDDTAGTNLVVHFPSELIETKAIETGHQVSCWVRKAGQARCYVHREHVRKADSGASQNSADYL